MKIYEILRESNDLILDSAAWGMKLRADGILYGFGDDTGSSELRKEIFKFIVANGDKLLPNTLDALKDVHKQLQELEDNKNEIRRDFE